VRHFARECFKGKQDYKWIKVCTTRLQQEEEIPKTPPSNEDNESKIIKRVLTSFYTPTKLESYEMTTEQEEELDQWINKELAAFRDSATHNHRGLSWWQCCKARGCTYMCSKY
jgi:hypothetical protein